MKHMLKISDVYLIGNQKSVTSGHPYLRILFSFVPQIERYRYERYPNSCQYPLINYLVVVVVEMVVVVVFTEPPGFFDEPPGTGGGGG